MAYHLLSYQIHGRDQDIVPVLASIATGSLRALLEIIVNFSPLVISRGKSDKVIVAAAKLATWDTPRHRGSHKRLFRKLILRFNTVRSPSASDFASK